MRANTRNLPAFFADVAVPFPLFQTFTYSVPEPIRNGLAPGCRVLVPFGARYLIGLTTKVHHESRPGEVKPVRQILDREPLFSPALLNHDGAIWPSDRPGLGIELNHEAAAEYVLDPADPRANRLGG